MIIGGYRILILDLGYGEQEQLLVLHAREQELRTKSKRPGDVKLREICAAECGVPELGYAAAFRYGVSRQSPEDFEYEIDWDRL